MYIYIHIYIYIHTYIHIYKLNKALNLANEYFRNVILMLYITQGNHYCLMVTIHGLRKKEVYFMCHCVLMMELKDVSSWKHTC